MNRIAVAASCFLAAVTLWAQDAPKTEKPAAAAEAAKPDAVLCPVSKHAANLFVKKDTPEGPVFFCCKDCRAPFEKEPAKYAAGVAAQRAVLAKLPKVQVTCPFSREPVKKDVFVEHDGQKTYFCCDDCKAKFDPKNAEHLAGLADAYTWQTKCPVMEGDIVPDAFTDLPTGERVYWCCPPCGKKYMRKLDEFSEKLAAQGYKLDLPALKAKLEAAGG